MTVLQPAGLSHSEIYGSLCMCHYPELIAAYHLLHRLSKPRHPPYALCNFFLTAALVFGYYFYIIALLFYSYKYRSEEHTSELQSRGHLVCRLLLEKKKVSVIETEP